MKYLIVIFIILGIVGANYGYAIEHSAISNVFTLDTRDTDNIKIEFTSVSVDSLNNIPVVGKEIKISGKLLKDGKGYKSAFGIHDSISQESRMIETDDNGLFSFTTKPMPYPDNYLISFLIFDKEFDALNIVAPAFQYQPTFVAPGLEVKTGQIGSSPSESDVSLASSKRTTGQSGSSQQSRLTVGRIASVGFQKLVQENVTPVSIAYWVVTGIVCLAPEPVLTKAACAGMVTAGIVAAKVNTAKAFFKSINELAVEDKKLKEDIDTIIDLGGLAFGIYRLSPSGVKQGIPNPLGTFGSAAKLMDVSKSNDGKITGYRMEVVTKDDEVIEIVAGKPKPGIAIAGKSPIDLVITAPNGAKFSKEIQGIEGAKYYELDIDGDGDNDDLVTLPLPENGEYSVDVIPEPNAKPNDTYSLEIMNEDKVITLADKKEIRNIDQPAKFEVSTSNTGNITVLDMQKSPYDINQDGVINILDMVLLAKNFGKVGNNVVGDFNGDGRVDSLDLDILSKHFGEKNQ